MPPRDVMAAASGRWPEILSALGGVTHEQLGHPKREGPCPACGGETRFRWDDDEGDAAWFCSHCGGKDRGGGGGTGVDLLMRLRGWSFPEAVGHVDGWLCGAPRVAQGGGGPPTRRTRRRASTELQAFHWLETAGQIGEGEAFVPSRAQGRAYSARWREWSEQASPAEIQGVMDVIRAMELEAEADGGVDDPGGAVPETRGPAAEEVVAELRGVAREQPRRAGPLTVEEVRGRLGAAVDDGASRSDLAALLLELGQASELSPAALRDLLRAIEATHQAEASVRDETERIAAAAGRQEVGGTCLTLAELFPPSLAHSIAFRVRHLPADDVTAAATFIATAAGVMKLGMEIVASVSDDFRAPLNFYGALVGRSGSKKSPPWEILMCKPMAPILADLAKRHQRAVADWKAENHGKKPAERTDPPVPLYATTSDFTAEALASQLQHQETAGLGLLISRDELAGMFHGLGAYKGGRGADSEQLLETYGGGGSRSLRVGVDGGGRFFSRCQLSIFGTIQPDVLEQLVSDGDASGLWARFQFIPMPERVVFLPAEETQEEIETAMAAADHLESVVGLLYRHHRVSLRLSRAARAVFVAYEGRCQGDALRASVAAQGAAWGKAAGKVLRVAGLLHLIHAVCPDGEHSEEVSEAMVLRACDLVDHLTNWTLGIHQSAMAGEATDLMRLVHRVAQAAGGPIGWRLVSQRLSPRQRKELDSAAALAAVDGLVALGMGERGTGARGGSWTYTALKDLPA